VIATVPLWQRLVILVPAFLIGGGIAVAACMLLIRSFAQNVRESGHQRLLFAGLVLLIGVVALATYLGIKIPRSE
jgi:hypothetical protein